MPRILQHRAGRPDAELGASAKADLSRRHGRVAELRRTSRPTEGRVGRGSGCLSGATRDLPATLGLFPTLNFTPATFAVDKTGRLCRNTDTIARGDTMTHTGF